MYRKFQKTLIIGALLFGFWMNAVLCMAAELTVTADTAKIRAEANTSSAVVGSTEKGKKITIEGETTDSSGMKWYKVSVGGNNYGYIRSDLVEASGTIQASSSSQTSDSQASKPAETQSTAIDEQTATINQRSVNIRSGASTSHGTVASLPQDTVITLIGEAKDSSGKQWYQMTCNYNNREITGYVRYDLITIGAPAEPADDEEMTEELTGEGAGEDMDTPGDDGQQPEDVQPNAEENNDYEVMYTQNDVGEYEYYLYDNVQGNRQKITELLNAVATANKNEELYKKQLNNEKIIIIILAVVIVVLALVVTVLLFKLRDLYDDYDEEDEEDYPPRKEYAVRNASERRSSSAREQAHSGTAPERSPVRSRNAVSGTQKTARPVPRTEPERNRSQGTRDAELRAAERSERRERPVSRPSTSQGSEGRKLPSRKPQNFLNDDDEFEFEFLNIDDKD